VNQDDITAKRLPGIAAGKPLSCVAVRLTVEAA